MCTNWLFRGVVLLFLFSFITICVFIYGSDKLSYIYSSPGAGVDETGFKAMDKIKAKHHQGTLMSISSSAGLIVA